jgi:hypothetical protein
MGNWRLALTDIAAATRTRPEALRRLLRALTAHGIVREEDDGTFTQTPLSDVLRSGNSGSMRAFVEVELGRDHYDSWREAESCLTQPGTAFERIFKMPVWQYYAEHPELQALFGEAMTNLTAIANAGVLGSYQFGAFSTAVDVGGGHGSFLAAILEGNPTAKGILFDLPSVIEDAAKGEFLNRLGNLSGGSAATSSSKCRPVATSTCSNSSCTIGTTLIRAAYSAAFAGRSLRAGALRSWRWFCPSATNRISVR